MIRRVLIFAAIGLLVAPLANAQTATVECVGTETAPGMVNGCGQMTKYAYKVTASPTQGVDSVLIGTHDGDQSHYSTICMPSNWTFAVVPVSVFPGFAFPDHSPKTAHGVVATPNGYCPFVVVFAIGGGLPINPATSFTFGFDNPLWPHDAAWSLREGFVWSIWGQPVGNGLGPVHSPGSCYQDTLPINTGYDLPNQTTYTPPTWDMYWRVMSDPHLDPVPHPAAVVSSIAWGAPEAHTQYIAANPNDNQSHAPVDWTWFHYYFCLQPGFVNARLEMWVRVDNSALVLLNGTPISGSLVGWQSPSPVTANNQSIFLPGRNCISVAVWNNESKTGLDIGGVVKQDNPEGVGPAYCCDSGAISGIKFFDNDGSGSLSAGDSPLAGWPMTLAWNVGGPFCAATTTDANGVYNFTGLPSATYTVMEDIPSNWFQTYPGGSYVVTALPGVTAVGQDFGNLPRGHLPSAPICPSPPSGMVLWLPFDDTVAGPGAVSKNVAGPSDGIQAGSTVKVAGVVRNALCFNGVDTWVDVASYPELLGKPLDPGTSDFSITAWVKRETGDNGVRTIVDKRDVVGSQVAGYSLFLNNGLLAIQLGDGTWYNNYGGTLLVPSDGQWHHIAVTVDRDKVDGGRFYVDNQAPSTFNPTGFQASIASANPFRVGARIVASPGTGVFKGCIDEVGMYRRALSEPELDSLHDAGSAGLCRYSCSVPPWVPFGTGQTSVVIPATICNRSTEDQTFEYEFIGLPNCGIPGPINYTPPDKDTTRVSAGECVTVDVTVTRPGGMTTFGQTGSYQMVAHPQGTLDYFDCRGRVGYWGSRWRFEALAHIVVRDTTKPLYVWISNLGNVSDTCDYTILARSPDNACNYDTVACVCGPDAAGNPDTCRDDECTVSLNGLPLGTPVTGTIILDPGDSTLVTLTARFVQPNPLGYYAIMVQGDDDGDGLDDPLASTGLRNILAPECSCPCHGDPQCDGVPNVQDVVKTVDVAFRGGAAVFDPQCPRQRTDVNCDGFSTILDVVKVINVAFRSANPATEFCNPCTP